MGGSPVVGGLLGRRGREPVAAMGASGRHADISGRHANIEAARGVAILAVFGYHFVGFWRAAGGAAGFGGAPHGLERRLWLYGGTWGVSVFVVVSALVLVRALDESSGLLTFYRRRLLRIFPLFWWIAVPLMGLAFAVGRMQANQLWKVPFWLTGTEILWPGRLWPVTAAWWFVTLIVQIYLVFPLLVVVARRFGPAPLMGLALVVNLVSLTLAQHGDRVFGSGAASFIGLAFVGCRLVEVAAGVSLGLLYWEWSAGRRPDCATVAALSAATSPLRLLAHEVANAAAAAAPAMNPRRDRMPFFSAESCARSFALGFFSFVAMAISSPYRQMTFSNRNQVRSSCGKCESR